MGFLITAALDPGAGTPEPLVYAVAMVGLWAFYLGRRRRGHQRAVVALAESTASGLTEPVSLHPLIDPIRCLGCGACVGACPEGEILGLIDGKAEMIRPTDCIGHGACRDACPTDAITLVFGTARRGVDIPTLSPAFETTVPGIFIAGELGGMGLVRNAIDQGRQAMESIVELCRERHGQPLDVVVVGAGPAGFSASLAALEHGLRAVTVEQDTLGGTVARYPRGKMIMTAPVELPLIGTVKFREVSKEQLLEFWRNVETSTDLHINYRERVKSIERRGEALEVTTTRATYRTRTVLLAIGRRGTPRKLGVPGEDMPKVVYSLVDPDQYRDQRVLVVGGGDSALEAAAALADTTGTRVTLSYRSEAFGRAKARNRARVETAAAKGRLTVLMKSTPQAVRDGAVDLVVDGSPASIENDAVIVCAGGILPTPFLASLGLELETKHGTA
ncbi:MAG: 4Fe-4S dicluster domain-containing protein [Myxococcales bacterium]|nr:MAG: 4Fe-4S dicluster domain-containing protein [Myxococcales bacterium]